MAQPDPENQQAAREWQSNPALHKEFTSFDAYAAYCRAVASGRAKVSQPRTLTVNVHTHDKPLSITRPDPGHHPVGGGFPAPDAADGAPCSWSHPISLEVLNTARDVKANNRHVGRSRQEDMIAAKANVSLEVACTARSMAIQQYDKRAAT